MNGRPNERPRVSETAVEQEPSFDFSEALKSLIGYGSLDDVPRVMFRRFNEIRLDEGISEETAAEQIYNACLLGTVEEIRQKLAELTPYKPPRSSKYPEPRALNGRSALEA